MDKHVIVFTMKGCPHCLDLKAKLTEENIEFIDRDIKEHSEEYDLFSEATGSDYVPAIMIIKNHNGKTSSKLLTPDRDFKTLDEGVDLVKKEIL